MIGGYYFNEDITQDSGLDYGADLRSYIDALTSIDTDPTSPTVGIPLTLVNGPTASPLFGIEQAFGFDQNTFFGDDVAITEMFEQDNEAYSIFGTVDYEVNDRLTLTVGANYTEDKKSVSASTLNNDAFSNLSLTGAAGTAIISNGIFANGNGAPGDADFVPSFNQVFMGAVPFTPANVQAAGDGAFGA